MENKGSWKGKIVDSFDFFGSVRYIIEITKPTGTYLIRRRYNNFYNLHKALTSFTDLAILTEQLQLPPKCYKLLGPSEQFLKARLGMLQSYLDTLSSAPGLREYSLVTEFIAQDGGGNAGFVDGAPSEPPLPFKPRLPPLPEGGFAALSGGSRLCAEADCERIYHDGEQALFGLFMLGQMLEISTNAQNRISAYDSQRPTTESSVLVLRSMVPLLEQVQSGLESANCGDGSGNGSKLMAYNKAVLENVQRGIEWGLSAEDREIEEIAKVHKGAKVRRLDHYKSAAATILGGSEADTGSAEKAARELGAQVRDEMEARSRAGEVNSVKRLRELWTALEELSTQQRAERRAAVPTTPERVAAGLRRRVETLSGKTEEIVLHQGAGSMGDARTTLEEVETLKRDIDGWKGEFGGKRFVEVEPSVAKTLEIAQHLEVSLRLMVKRYDPAKGHEDEDRNVEMDDH